MIGNDSCRTANEVEPPILPASRLTREDLDDETLDDLYVVEDTEIGDFTRGGK